MVSLAFIGDCHLGYRHRSKLQRLKDYAKAFEESVDSAIRMNPDAIVFLGDLVHHSRPDPVTLSTVLKRLMAVAEKRPVIVCIGNHEIEGHLGTSYSPIYGDVHKNIHVLTSENPHVKLKFDDKTYGFHGFEYTRSREMAEEKLKVVTSEVDADVNILCLHQAIEKYLSPHEISLALLRQVAPKYDLMISGHVHKHQMIKEVSDVTPTYYCGATERISFNEASNPTGFMVFLDDLRKPEYISVDSAPMTYVQEEFTGKPAELNRRIEGIISVNPAPLLKIDIAWDIDGDFMDLRRDWSAFEGGRTILEVTVAPKSKETEIQLDRIDLTEELITEYFQKTGNTNKELEELCIELFRRHAA
jgi:DNA repair exonuclease SbcCD nuclease subunit